MRRPVVMDTNVAVVANGEASQARPDCVTACVSRIKSIQKEESILVDDFGIILREYRRRLRPRGEPGIGHQFFLWLTDHLGDETRCRQVQVTPNGERGFEEFPDSEDLRDFDRDDRVFVAVAIASGVRPPVVNASDTDWWDHREALARHGVEIEFLCPELMPEAASPARPQPDRTGQAGALR